MKKDKVFFFKLWEYKYNIVGYIVKFSKNQPYGRCKNKKKKKKKKMLRKWNVKG